MDVLYWFGVIHSNSIWKLNEFIGKEGKNRMSDYVQAVDRISEMNYGEGAAMTGLMYMVEAKNVEGVEILLKQGSDADFGQARFGQTALMLAAEVDSVDIVRLLLAHNANVLCVNEQGYVPLSFAVQNNNMEMMKLLVDAGASVDGMQSTSGEVFPPLHDACGSGGPPEVVKWLLQQGADPNQVDTYGISPLQQCSDNPTFIFLLLEYGVNILHAAGYCPLSLNLACRGELGSQQAAKLLIESGCDVNCCDDFGLPSICTARTVSLLHLLLQNGADLESLQLLDRQRKETLTPELIECFESRLVDSELLQL